MSGATPGEGGTTVSTTPSPGGGGAGATDNESAATAASTTIPDSVSTLSTTNDTTITTTTNTNNTTEGSSSHTPLIVAATTITTAAITASTAVSNNDTANAAHDLALLDEVVPAVAGLSTAEARLQQLERLFLGGPLSTGGQCYSMETLLDVLIVLHDECINSSMRREKTVSDFIEYGGYPLLLLSL